MCTHKFVIQNVVVLSSEVQVPVCGKAKRRFLGSMVVTFSFLFFHFLFPLRFLFLFSLLCHLLASLFLLEKVMSEI